jgi:toxin ParE1/3/4
VATRDLERVAAFLWHEAPMRAGEIIDRIVVRADSLVQSPMRGRTPPELAGVVDRTWREIIESPWRILYRVHLEKVHIHGILDGRRNLQDLLMERLLRG